MPARLATFNFHLVDRYPHLPQRALDVFQASGNPSPGVRVLAPQSKPDTLTTTCFLSATSLANTAIAYQTAVGGIWPLVVDKIAYDNFPYRYRFLVMEVQIVSTRVRARASGRDISGAFYNLSPAGELVARWTLLPIPLD